MGKLFVRPLYFCSISDTCILPCVTLHSKMVAHRFNDVPKGTGYNMDIVCEYHQARAQIFLTICYTANEDLIPAMYHQFFRKMNHFPVVHFASLQSICVYFQQSQVVHSCCLCKGGSQCESNIIMCFV